MLVLGGAVVGVYFLIKYARKKEAAGEEISPFLHWLAGLFTKKAKTEEVTEAKIEPTGDVIETEVIESEEDAVITEETTEEAAEVAKEAVTEEKTEEITEDAAVEPTEEITEDVAAEPTEEIKENSDENSEDKQN